MAARRAVLPVQDFSHGDDFVGVDLDDHGVHSGALHGHLSPPACPRRLHSTEGRSDDCRRLAGGVRHCPAVPAAHQNVLLPGRPEATRTSSKRLAHLQHSDVLAVAHALLLSGEFTTSNRLCADCAMLNLRQKTGVLTSWVYCTCIWCIYSRKFMKRTKKNKRKPEKFFKNSATVLTYIQSVVLKTSTSYMF